MISRNEVPKYLQNGSFFQTLDATDKEGFEVPFDCLKADLTIESDQDLSHVLHSIRFWGVYDMPGEILRYAVKNAEETYLKELVTEFPEFEEYLDTIIALKACQHEQAISLAYRLNLGVEVVKFLHDEMCCPIVQDQFVVAARHDDLPSLLFFIEEIPSIADQLYGTVIATAAEHGSMEVLKHALKEGWFIDNYHLLAAVSGGRIEAVKFLHEVCGKEYSAETMQHAVNLKSEHLEMVIHLHESGCPWDEEVCAAFASKNLLDCLTFAHQQGCPWDERTCTDAAGEGNLRCLQYAHLQGCPLHEDLCKYALLGGSWGCVWYALCNGAISDNVETMFKAILYMVGALIVRQYYRDVGWAALDWAIVSCVFHLLHDVMAVILITKHLHPAVNMLRYVFMELHVFILIVATLCQLGYGMGLVLG